MKNVLVGLILIISPFLSFGHNPLSARYHLEAGENATLLSINLSQSGVNQVFYNKYGEEELGKMDQKQFKELIVAYIKNNFSLSVNNTKFELKEGGIKLGSHQSDLKFVLLPFPKEIEEIFLHIPAFKENENHQTIFSYNMYGNKDKVILRSANNYQSTLQFADQTLYGNLWWLTLVGVVIVILGYVIKRKAENIKSSLQYY